MNNKPIIYLAGNMTPSAENYYKWTDRISKKLKLKFRSSISKFKTGEKWIVRQDLGRLQNAHMVIVNLGVTDSAHHLTGLIVECYEAYKQNMPVYAFTSREFERSQQGNSPWLQYSITQEFTTEDELIEYLLDSENLIV